MNNHKKRKSGGGRKKLPESEKISQVVLSVKNADIEKLGGKSAVQDICYKALKRKLSSTINK